MTRGVAVLLTLLVLAAALFTGWYSNRRVLYFPPEFQKQVNDCELHGFRTREPVQDDFQAAWFSGVLADLEEPSLFQRREGSPRSVRLTLIPSFHPPFSVRVDTRDDGRLVMTEKRLAPSDYDWKKEGRFSGERVRLLSGSEAQALDSVLAETGLARARSTGCSDGVVDGMSWIVETSDPEHGYRYHYRQWAQDEPVRDIGLHMLGLAGWDDLPPELRPLKPSIP
ncbi:MAG: hypothetical protein V7672_03715 [Brevundimonas sp.]|uniref:hypothetical protein n=1 Tax=Brevundimonas sp. TaxID=1871086 RepID=UPI0030024334